MAAHPFSHFMDEALALAREAAAAGEVPVGAVVVSGGTIVGRGRNRTLADHDPSGHAEIVALRDAAQTLGNHRLGDCDLWVTLEPCAMCAGAIAHARIARLYYGASDPKGGAVEHGARLFAQAQTLHAPQVYSGMAADEAGALLREFFAERRD